MIYDSVEKIREEAIKAYQSKPTLIRQHYNQEQKERQGYCKRPLLELLQNIEDALNHYETVDTDKPQALFYIKEATLYIANQGKAFDKRGFQSLCDSDDSPKHGKGYIGSKGTGFKSVLNWTDQPEIHSGEIHACFNRQEAARIIQEEITSDTYNKLKEEDGWQGEAPLLRVPLNADPDDITQELLSGGWSTIIKLPLLQEVEGEVLEELTSFDSTNILFLRNLSSIEFRLPDKDSFHIVRKPKGENRCTIFDGKNEPIEYAIFRKKLSNIQPKKQKELGGSCEVAIAYRTNTIEIPTPYPLFNFFPIRNAPAPFAGLLIHASFLLKADRDDLSEDDPEFHKNLTHDLVEMLTKNVVPSMAKELGPSCLHLLRIPDNKGSEHIQNIHDKLHECIRNIAFVPDLEGKQFSPPNLYLWKWELGNLLQVQRLNPVTDGARLCAPDWQKGNQEVLRQYGMQDLDNLSHIKALKNIKPDCVNDGLKALHIIDKAWDRNNGAIDDVRGFSLWQKQDEEFRALADEPAFFEKSPPHTNNQDLPDWLQFDVLHSDFKKALEDRELWGSLKIKLREAWFKPSTKDALLEHAISPSLEGKSSEWWCSHGMQALSFLKSIELAADNELIQKDPLRSKLAKVIHVPVQNGDWQPAGKVYASKDWYQGEPAWGEALSKLENRFLLISPDSLEECEPNNISWENLLRYIGASWYPKIVKGSGTANICPFAGSQFKNEWNEYIKEIHPVLSKSNDEYMASHSENKIEAKAITSWGLEGLNLIRNIKADHTSILILFRKQFDNDLKTIIERKGPSGGGRPNFTPETSFLTWQLRHTPVFPVNQTTAVLANSEAESASSMFMDSGVGWKGWLPTLDVSRVENEAQRDELRAFANKGLGTLYRVQNATPRLWLNWLKRLKEICNPDDQTIVSPLKSFMSDFGNTLSTANEMKPSILNGLEYPCESSNGIRFTKKTGFYILDEHKWEPIKSSILDSDHLLLLVNYKGGKKVADLLELENRLLSNALTLKLSDDLDTDIRKTEGLKNLLSNTEKRARVLALVAHSVPHKAEKMAQEWPDNIQVDNHLNVSASLEKQSLGNIELPYYWDSDSLHLNGLGNLHQHLAKALVEHADLASELEDALTNIIRYVDQSIDEADEYLSGKNITEEDINRWLETVPAPPPLQIESDLDDGVPTPESKKSESKQIKSVTPVSNPSPAPSSRKATRSSQSIGRSSTGGGRPSPEKGRDAEQWLQEFLREHLPEDWSIEDISHQHQHHKEADILLCKDNKEIFIEVKHRERGLINLPQSEVESAQSLQTNYWMAVLVPNESDEEYDQCWLNQPLEILAEYCKKGMWHWKDKYDEETGVDPVKNSWKPPTPPNRPADSFEFRVDLPEEALRKHFVSFEEFHKAINNL